LSIWVSVIDGAESWYDFSTRFVDLLSRYWNNPALLSGYPSQLTLYNVLYALARAASEQATVMAMDPALIALLTQYTNRYANDSSFAWIANNAVATGGGWLNAAERFGNTAIATSALATLTNFYHSIPRLSETHLWVVWGLLFGQNSNCRTFPNSEQLCKQSIVDELEATLFPYSYSFDDGALIFRTSLSLEKVQALYQASKEVRAEFHNISTYDTPVSGDVNTTLIAKIYASRADYVRYHTFLYGLGTSNGGIYIESWGTFFTYDRTLSESLYSLEELFRHEYVHYLQGRYLVPGAWGASLYDNGRLIWYEEGMAEFLAGSNIARGVLPRRNLAGLIASDPQGKMALNSVVSAGYGDFRFYSFAGMLFQYFYASQKALLKELFATIRVGDGAGFDVLIAAMKGDAALGEAYDDFLDSIIRDESNFSNPSSNLAPLRNLSSASTAQIENSIRALSPSTGFVCADSAATLNRRFQCAGHLLGINGSWASVWYGFDSQIKSLERSFGNSSITNLRATTCRIKNIVLSNTADYLADVHCEGPLALASANQQDQCPNDLLKTSPGASGCGVPEGAASSSSSSASTSSVSSSSVSSQFTSSSAQSSSSSSLPPDVYHQPLSAPLVAVKRKTVTLALDIKSKIVYELKFTRAGGKPTTKRVSSNRRVLRVTLPAGNWSVIYWVRSPKKASLRGPNSPATVFVVR